MVASRRLQMISLEEFAIENCVEPDHTGYTHYIYTSFEVYFNKIYAMCKISLKFHTALVENSQLLAQYLIG